VGGCLFCARVSGKFITSNTTRGFTLSFFANTGSAVSFKEKDVEFVGLISGPITTVQDTEFGSDKPKVWKDGTPALKALVPLTTPEGDVKTLHVPASSRLHKSIGAALAAAGVGDLEQGGMLGITWTGFGTGKNASNPPKVYDVRYLSAADVAAQNAA
jgi:hypothetical protein